MLKQKHILSFCVILLVIVSLSMSCIIITPREEPSQSQSSSEATSDIPAPTQEPESSTPPQSQPGQSPNSPQVEPSIVPTFENQPVNASIPQTGEKPDLVITSISKYEGTDGYDRIKYRVKNQGSGSAGPCAAALSANDVYKVSDNIPAIAAGQELERQFDGWKYDLSTPTIKIRVDSSNQIAEANENNNEKVTTFARITIYDFVANAPSAKWESWIEPNWSELSCHDANQTRTATKHEQPFGGNLDNPRGFATYRTNEILEDGQKYSRVLEMHPRWDENGAISGLYAIPQGIKPGSYFYAKVGFLGMNPPYAGNVRFEFEATSPMSSYGMCEPYPATLQLIDNYDGKIETIMQKLPYIPDGIAYLRVYSMGQTYQDWACWVEAKIVR